MRNIWLILQREVRVKVRKKLFIISTLLTPLLFVLMAALPAILMRINVTDTQKRIAVVDSTRYLYPLIAGGDTARFVEILPEMGVAPGALLREGYSGVLVLEGDLVEVPSHLCYYSRKAATVDLEHEITSRVKEAIQRARLSRAEIPALDSIIRSIQAKVRMRTVVLGKDGQTRETSSGLMTGLGYLLGGVSYVLIMLSGMMVMNGVVEEKANRIIEVLACSARPFQLMIGKILGIATVFFIQIALWGVLSLILLFAVGRFLDGEASMGVFGSMPGGAGMEGLTDAGAVNQILAPLLDLNIGAIVSAFLLFFLFGYLFYASLFAAVGSSVDEPYDAGQLTTPLTMPLMIGFVSVFIVSRAPEGGIAFWLSQIPLTSPVVMPVRVIYGVPLWELGLSLGLLVGSFLLLTWMAGRVYSKGILMSGRHGWRGILRWLRGG